MFQLNKKYVGQMIQEVREQRGLQQKDLASKIGVSQSTMSKIEAGGWKKADIETFVNISKTLNVRLEYLLGIDKDIDDDTHLVNLFMKKFFRIITTQKFIKNNSVFAQEDIENSFYSVKGRYVVLEGPKRIFSLIKKVAKAMERRKEEQKELIEKAINEYRREGERTIDKYFLLSKGEMLDLVKEYMKGEKAGAIIKKMPLLENIEE